MKIKQDRIKSRQDAIFKLPIKSVITRSTILSVVDATQPDKIENCSVERYLELEEEFIANNDKG